MMLLRGGLLLLTVLLPLVLGSPRPQYSGHYEGQVDQTMIDVRGLALIEHRTTGQLSLGHLRCWPGQRQVRQH